MDHMGAHGSHGSMATVIEQVKPYNQEIRYTVWNQEVLGNTPKIRFGGFLRIPPKILKNSPGTPQTL